MLWGLFKTSNYSKLKSQAKDLRKLADKLEKFAEEDRQKQELQEKLHAIGTKEEIVKPEIELIVPNPIAQRRYDKGVEFNFPKNNYRPQELKDIGEYFNGTNNEW